MELAILQNFLIALALGALVGLEREYARYRKRGNDYAGIRTFPLIALFGALSAYLGELISPMILIVGIVLTGILIIFAYYNIAGHSRHHSGATSEVAGFLVFFLGVLSYYGEVTLAIVLAVIITIILYARSMLHHFAKKIKPLEMADTLKFAVIAFVILPLLPNQGYGPLEMFNPYVIWLMVVFISGIGFAGYVLMKWFGERGITIAGILGGLVSSTAVTSSFAVRSKKETKIYRTLVLGVILANTIMFVRILIEVFVINKELLWELILPISILIVICAIFSYLLWRKAKEAKGKVHLSSPFTLGPALKFGVFFAVILALVKVADVYLSSKGVYLVSFISGFADVDAITVSLSQLSKTSLSLDIARNGILLAALTNVGVKGGIAYIFGDRKKFGKIILAFYVVLILLGLGLMWVF
ncbi:MgtC/SapB family protein [Candidatus Woesearchaeota archaeon]|jgi:uncharacterized membrane protein (DUF4010 family)|nr:MgtC/SapB family protein [Candidatus Woesearchaeota archaeon]MBT4336402.1 MgtC/SapB family protein [Candidatus Woesearchaeota archaeon]MBT4469943.1 MgtC/SapB family protein [Candidatus Woesearchaeota archaeon]MBT6744333.1 MgtC/SapB family protein [Candidatus Woesearchaeota archaeon]